MCALVEGGVGGGAGGSGGGGDKDGPKIEKTIFCGTHSHRHTKGPRDVDLCVLLPSASWPDFSVASGSKRLKVFCVPRY